MKLHPTSNATSERAGLEDMPCSVAHPQLYLLFFSRSTNVIGSRCSHRQWRQRWSSHDFRRCSAAASFVSNMAAAECETKEGTSADLLKTPVLSDEAVNVIQKDEDSGIPLQTPWTFWLDKWEETRWFFSFSCSTIWCIPTRWCISILSSSLLLNIDTANDAYEKCRRKIIGSTSTRSLFLISLYLNNPTCDADTRKINLHFTSSQTHITLLFSQPPLHHKGKIHSYTFIFMCSINKLRDTRIYHWVQFKGILSI